MDIRTVMLMLAVGSTLFGLLLVIFKLDRNNPHHIPFWTFAKFLQAAGSFLMYLRPGTFDTLTVLACTALLLGCVYETWTILYLTGEKIVKRSVHVLTTAGIILVCILAIFMNETYKSGVIFLLQSVFYFLPGLLLLFKSEIKSPLQKLLGICYCFSGIVFLTASIICLGFPNQVNQLQDHPISSMIPCVSYCIFLMSALILLMLAKERSDMQIKVIQETLHKSALRFQQIVENSIEGIVIFDKDYKVTFANKNMASLLGYTVDELLGRPYISFFPESQLDIYRQQESLRKKGEDSVYECRLLRKDGQTNWFLVSAQAILNESGNFEGSFAILTDINSRKEMELIMEESNRQLTELSNKDSLTGIANRRRFDAILGHEFSKLSRTHSQLSLIMIDIDYFKEYNDFYGHVMGDECLRQIGNVLDEVLGKTVHLAARYGGEEFACILPDTDINSAVDIAAKISKRIQDLKIEHKKSSVSRYVTASFGVTTVKYSPDIFLDEIVCMADKLLYKAKVSGRNRIEFAEFQKQPN